MTDDYYPFDFGAWKSKEGLNCPKHGLQQGGLAIAVTPYRDRPPITRKYCGLCVLEALDACARLNEP
jgi:hypothetical protein